MSSMAEVMQQIRDRIAANPAKIAGIKTKFQFELTGEGGGAYHAVFDDGAYDIGEGAIENPACSIVISAADFTALATGKLNPTAAFMSGKLKIKGDMAQAMRLQTLFS
ncbi:MAG TPA: SCP2 sterol-binding domain-containing protein [Symbiobacteriaceae bacterium]|nr:SCP2 sterol-binding domain-containing protein [Symbiobacteriaceae bacterium]